MQFLSTILHSKPFLSNMSYDNSDDGYNDNEKDNDNNDNNNDDTIFLLFFSSSCSSHSIATALKWTSLKSVPSSTDSSAPSVS